MKTTNIILIAIAILVIALVAVGLYSVYDGNTDILDNVNITNPLDNNTTDVVDVDNMTNMTNVTDSVVVVGDNSTRTDLTINNTTYKVYNPQSDSYVPVIGEKFDDEVNRWYTYDEDGVRYYNTRINQG